MIYLLGTTRDEFGGSEWAHVVHGDPRAPSRRRSRGRARAGRDPGQRVAGRACRRGSRYFRRRARSGPGGVVPAVGVGARVWVPDEIDLFVFLFAESAARAIVAVPRSEEVRFTDMCTARRFPHQRIGVVDDGAGDLPWTSRSSSPFRWPSCERRIRNAPCSVRELIGAGRRGRAEQGAATTGGPLAWTAG